MESSKLKAVIMQVLPVKIELKRHPTKRYKRRKLKNISMIVLHCTDRDWHLGQLATYDVEGSLVYKRECDGQLVSEQNHISSKGLAAVTYHSVVLKDSVYETLDPKEISYHAAGYNKKSLAVAMMYRTTNPYTNKGEWSPSENMVKLTQCHLGDLCLKYKLTPSAIKGHRELKGTGWDWIRGRKRLLKSCPGLFVDMDKVRKNVAIYMQCRLKIENKYDGKIDGVFGSKSIAALEKA